MPVLEEFVAGSGKVLILLQVKQRFIITVAETESFSNQASLFNRSMRVIGRLGHND